MDQIESGCLTLSNHTIFTGGHFMMTAEGPHLNSGTLKSFRHAAQLYSRARKQFKNIGLGILINDIGVVCSAASCSIVAAPSRDSIELPAEYLQILSEFRIDQINLKIFWEKHIRNRAKKLLHKELSEFNKDIRYSEGGYVYQSNNKIPIILTRHSSMDKYGTPACPLIMSAYCMEQERLRYNKCINFYYVGSDNYLNVSNHYVIEKGRFLANRFGNRMDIMNVYQFDDGSMSISDKL